MSISKKDDDILSEGTLFKNARKRLYEEFKKALNEQNEDYPN